VSDDLDAWLEDYRPYISSTKVCGRADLILAHAEADVALHVARQTNGDILGTSPEVVEAKRRVDDIQAQIERSEKEFTFQGVGQRGYFDLKKAHPPKEEDVRNGTDVHMETFAPALIAASSLEPKVTEAQAKKMLDRFPLGEFQKLFDTAFAANGQVVGTPKSGAAALIELSRLNGGSSTTALPEESPGASS
jgi:hypothetical protein